MPKNIAEYEDVTTSLTVEMPEGGEFGLTYYPGRYTPEFLDRMEDQSTHRLLGHLLHSADLVVWESVLNWHRREVERKKKILALQLERNSLEMGSPERGKVLIELQALLEAEPRPQAPIEGDREVPLPLDAESLTLLHMRMINAMAQAITRDQIPNRRRDVDLDSSF